MGSFWHLFDHGVEYLGSLTDVGVDPHTCARWVEPAPLDEIVDAYRHFGGARLMLPSRAVVWNNLEEYRAWLYDAEHAQRGILTHLALNVESGRRLLEDRLGQEPILPDGYELVSTAGSMAMLVEYVG